MVEETPNNLTKTTINIFLEDGIKKLQLYDENLKIFNLKKDELNGEYGVIGDKIDENTKIIIDMGDEAVFIKFLIKILRLINIRKDNPTRSETLPELKKLFDRKFEQREDVAIALQQLDVKMKSIQLQVKEMKDQIQISVKNILNEGKYLMYFKKQIQELAAKKLVAIRDVEQLELDLRAAIAKRDIPQLSQINVEEIITAFKNTVKSLHETTMKYYKTKSLNGERRMAIKSLAKRLLAKEVELEKLLLNECELMERSEKIARQIKICTDIENKTTLREKIRVAEKHLHTVRQTLSATKGNLNKNNNTLFNLSFKVTILKANIESVLNKRDELEAQIALEMSKQ